MATECVTCGRDQVTRVQRSAIRIQMIRGQHSGIRVQDSGIWHQGSRIKVQSSGFRDQGSEFRDQARFRVAMFRVVGSASSVSPRIRFVKQKWCQSVVSCMARCQGQKLFQYFFVSGLA